VRHEKNMASAVDDLKQSARSTVDSGINPHFGQTDDLKAQADSDHGGPG
jgi:hypothetical protein